MLKCLTCNICPLSSVHGFINATYMAIEEEPFSTFFQLNVKGTTRLSGLVIRGTIELIADPTSGTQVMM